MKSLNFRKNRTCKPRFKMILGFDLICLYADLKMAFKMCGIF